MINERCKRDEHPGTFRMIDDNFLVYSDMKNRAGLEELSLSKNEIPHWYVMRDLKRINAVLPAYKQLAALHMDFFTPMKERLTLSGGKKIREEVPFLQDLLFVYATREKLDPVVQSTPTLQYRFVRGGAYREAMTVRSNDMECFIHAIRTTVNPRYYKPEELTPAMKGRRVRIIGGPLDNYEGALLTVRGSKNRRLLLEIPNLISAGVEITNCDYILL